MSLPLELHLGLVRLSTELGNLQRTVQDVLNCGEMLRGDTGSEDAVAKAQYLALEAAIRTQEGRTQKGRADRADRTGRADRAVADESMHIERQHHDTDPGVPSGAGKGWMLVSADRGTRIALKPHERSLLLRIGCSPGQRVSRDDLRRVLDAASPSPESPATPRERRSAGRR